MKKTKIVVGQKEGRIEWVKKGVEKEKRKLVVQL